NAVADSPSARFSVLGEMRFAPSGSRFFVANGNRLRVVDVSLGPMVPPTSVTTANPGLLTGDVDGVFPDYCFYPIQGVVALSDTLVLLVEQYTVSTVFSLFNLESTNRTTIMSAKASTSIAA